ncbi:MAG: acyl-CoA thioesterase/BAAT N-terminal domain-containing protein [Peptoniphilaceae bacterium]|nr:acyl-CoA thioesterase/BAAT N-terminal domain-containing protein [Peptoniphilaceae bacterium]
MKIEYKDESSFSDPLNIKVKNLNPNQTIFATLKTKINSNIYQSSVKLNANENGEVNLDKSDAYDGIYSGKLEGGLLLTLSNFTNEIYNFENLNEKAKFILHIETKEHFNETKKSFKITDPLHDLNEDDNFKNEDENQKIVFYKSFSYNLNYKRVDENMAHMDILYKNENDPIVLIFSSSSKKKNFHIASFFANNGFVAVNCEYFANENLPEACFSIPVEIFKDIKYSLQNIFNFKKVNIFGIAEGAGLGALIAKEYFKDINKLVFMSPNFYIFQGLTPQRKPRSFYQKNGKDMDFVKLKFNLFDQIKISKQVFSKNPVSLLDIYEKSIKSAKNLEKKVLPYDKLSQDILLFGGEDDKMNDTKNYCEKIKKLRNEKNLKTEIFLYEDVGHYINAPFYPQYQRNGKTTFFGGNIEKNAKASVDIYKKIKEFFNETTK